MRPRSRALLTLLVLGLLGPARVTADNLDKDDRKWLDEVRPLILPDEEKLFKELKDKADREEFRKIFWARRDPDLKAPGNPFEEQYEKARAEANRRYFSPGHTGSSTDCGRVFLLLGKPDDVESTPGTVGTGLRAPEIWIYRDRPGQTFTGGEARIAFDSECRSAANLDAQLRQIAASKVVHPNLEYRRGPGGHLVKLEDLLPKESPVQVLLRTPREDFPLETDVSYLRAPDGQTGALGLVRGHVPNPPVEERGGRKVLDVVVLASAAAPGAPEPGWVERKAAADVRPDGSFLASFGLILKPGTYTLKAGTLVEKTSQGTLVSQPIEVPDFSGVETGPDGSTRKVASIGSILFLRDIEDIPAGATSDPTDPYAAFQLGSTRLIPYFGRELSPSDTVTFLYFVYDLDVDPQTQKADTVAALSILKDGRNTVARARDFPITTPMGSTSVGPVPLAAYAPGSYVVQLKVTDRLAKNTVVKNERFTIQAPATAPATPPAAPSATP
jgi:GWxTD domain-containing protein